MKAFRKRLKTFNIIKKESASKIIQNSKSVHSS